MPTTFLPFGVIVTAPGPGAELNAGAVITYEEKSWQGPMAGSQAAFAASICSRSLFCSLRRSEGRLAVLNVRAASLFQSISVAFCCISAIMRLEDERWTNPSSS